MKKVGQVVRQGDMVFMKVDGATQANKKSVENLVVGLGEVSGHSHDVQVTDGAELIEYAETEAEFGSATRDKIVFEVKNGIATVTHEEHNPITLDEGFWVRINQINYDPFRDELEKVRD